MMKHTWKKIWLPVLASLLVCFPALFSMASTAQAAPFRPRLSHTRMTVTTGSTSRLEMKNTYRTVKWSYTGSNVISVKKNGRYAVLITGKKPGNASIKAAVDGKIYTCRITVRDNPSLSVKSATLNIGSSVDITVTGTVFVPKWSTTNKSVAVLTKIGTGKYRITGKKAGSATFMASVGGKKLRCHIKVVDNRKSKYPYGWKPGDHLNNRWGTHLDRFGKLTVFDKYLSANGYFLSKYSSGYSKKELDLHVKSASRKVVAGVHFESSAVTVSSVTRGYAANGRFLFKKGANSVVFSLNFLSNGKSQQLTVNGKDVTVKSDDPSVVKVRSISGKYFTLTGEHAGSTYIHVLYRGLDLKFPVTVQ